jgi:tRNA(Leu) C34 or U34 (ribose-2'-O)-methylase TrmL
MFIKSDQSHLRLEALDNWREAARLVSDRWERFLRAEPEVRMFAFASYVASLESEEAAAANLAELTRLAAA